MAQPSSHLNGEHPVIAFDGAISTTTIHIPDRAFAAEIVFRLDHPQLIKLGSQKPPLHFHPYQDEYFRVVEGRLGFEINGKECVIGPGDGEICVTKWSHHRLYPPPNDGSDITKFIASGAKTEEAYKLDNLFFSNWYAYQDAVVLSGKRFNVVQVMSMFDAGGSYLSLPWWVPFGRTLARVVGIVVGRWIGGLLGYQPFYRDWSCDWDIACARMDQSIFQRRFAKVRKRT